MSKPKDLPKQKQEKQPGKQQKMHPEPEVIRKDYKGSDKLKGKVALITGGDSGIGQSVAVHFAKEGARVAIVYLSEDKDANETINMIEKAGSEGLALKGDLKDEKFCEEVVQKTVDKFGGLNILVNNAAMQFPKEEPEEVTPAQVRKTFETNIYPYFFVVNEALKHLKDGDSIINTTSVTAYRGSEHLLDYSSTKGAITSYTRSLSKMLAEKNIRVNGVAPGPIWTPLIPASFDAEHVAEFGKKVPLGRAGQPSEVGPAYVFLASKDASYITGQVIHVNGGEVVGA
ncbi:SDR family oxidoreductase [Salinimicrobium tongyeongense]|uniref:SDR family oxidoreductase n=1 Tax=Salinimicrobium tongyeongense TaxID=2809707 RepID=A0ABY6NMQ6_9FLAO|nr:SDR family oxidoreductase [Salinimicrobium tongyeongense]UZH54180.1 SDR family oxidoreductase [Salinimicrobium tongyeongense]